MTIEEVLAREEIRETIATYTMSGDRGDIESYAATFAEDGLLDSPIGSARGPAGILAFVRDTVIPDMAKQLQTARLRHHITTSRIEFQSKTEAQAWTYFQLIGGGSILESGVYVDRLRLTGERWLFAHRQIRMEWESRTR